MKRYKFTVITVCYNAEKHIAKTIQSLLCQTYKDYEYIIKDGDSTDGTREIINSLITETSNIHVVSSKDDGIYDAMNQAVHMSQGEYIYFLNAGDWFASENVLKRIADFIDANNVSMVYGNVVHVKKDEMHVRKYGKICRNKLFFLSGDCICHQALFARKELFDKKKFDLQYRVCADKEWELFHIFDHAAICNVDCTIAYVPVEGFALSHVETFEKETHICLKKYYKHTVWIYELLMQSKKSRVMLKLFRWIEKVFFFAKHEAS